MKTLIITIAVLSILTLSGIALTKNGLRDNYQPAAAALNLPPGRNLRRAELAIEGMWCASCATGAEYNLKAITGVIDAYVGFTNDLDSQGWVIYETEKVNEDQIIKAIEPYQATITTDTQFVPSKTVK